MPQAARGFRHETEATRPVRRSRDPYCRDRRRAMTHRIAKVLIATCICAAALSIVKAAEWTQEDDDPVFARVLLISIDGLHAGDLDRFVATHENSALAGLTATGRTYTNASATKPSDSFP